MSTAIEQICELCQTPLPSTGIILWLEGKAYHEECGSAKTVSDQADRIVEKDALIKDLVGALEVHIDDCDKCHGTGALKAYDDWPDESCGDCEADRTLIAKATKESG